MILLDSLFWNYYCFFKRHKIFFWFRGDAVDCSSALISLSFVLPLIPLSDKWTMGPIIILILIFLSGFFFLWLDKHYRKADIAKNDYYKIRIKWENTSHKKKKIKHFLIIIFTIYGTIGWFILLVIISRIKGTTIVH